MSNLTEPISAAALPPVPLSPGRRAWQRFRRNRLGFFSLLIFSVMVVGCLFAEVLSNDKPLVVHYQGQWYFPLVQDYPESTFGGDFPTPADYLDPFIRDRITGGDNWAIYPPNPYGPKTLNYFADLPNPARPTAANVFGTDDRGRPLRHFSWAVFRDGELGEVSHRWYSPEGELLYRQVLAAPLAAKQLTPC